MGSSSTVLYAFGVFLAVFVWAAYSAVVLKNAKVD